MNAEAKLLRSAGLEVIQHDADNGEDGWRSMRRTLKLALSSAWSQSSWHLVRHLCRLYRPDILHVHNFWTALTPSVHAAAHSEGVPTVQTLHNYRLLCTNALLLRNDKPCVECVGKLPWRGVVHKCYRNSLPSSAAVAHMIVSNRARQTWHRHVNAFIALSHFSRWMLQAGGVPQDRLFVKPNFVEDPGETATQPSQSRTMAYVGRLSREKGVGGLLAAWALLAPSERGRLVIVGAGPEERALRESARSLGLSEPEVVFAGPKQPAEVLATIATARALIQPSICFENSPRSVLEAFACGRSVIASDIGALGEIVGPHVGMRVPSNDPGSLAAAMARLLREPIFANELGRNARAEFLARYSATVNLDRLLEIYKLAAQWRHLPEGGRDLSARAMSTSSVN